MSATKHKLLVKIWDLIVIGIGSSCYSFGIVFFNMNNHLADGGVTGVTLILKALFNINPAYSTILVNIPLLLIGIRFLSHKDMLYTLYGTSVLSVSLWLWQKLPLTINIQHDLLLSAIIAGLIGGFGVGLVFRMGGTTGGIDIIARLFERFKGIPMGQSLLVIDVLVLLSSLVYLDVRQMAYTIIYVFIFSQVVNYTQQGAYTARGILIISSKPNEIANNIMAQLSRGVTYLDAQGGYSHEPKQVIYCVVAPNELHDLKSIVSDIDEQAFMSIIDVNEAIGEGFTYKRPKRFKII